MDRNKIEEMVTSYIKRSMDYPDIDKDTDLFKVGVVHSLFAVQLVIFIEKAFHIELEEELTIDNMRSIRTIAELIDKKSSRT